MKNSYLIWSVRAFLPCAVIAFGTIDVAASPFTVYFTGRTVQYYDYKVGTDDPAKVGENLSGWATFDIANVEFSSNVDNGFFALASRSSDHGCSLITNGTCVADHGTQMPVVTDYSLYTSFAPAGGYVPIADSANFYDTSLRQNLRNVASSTTSGFDGYTVSRGQQQDVIVGDVAGSFDFDSLARVFQFLPSGDSNALLASVFDLSAAPNLAAVPNGQPNVFFNAYALFGHCDVAPNCTTGFGDGSFNFSAALTSLRVVPGPAAIPEPTTLTVLVGALLCLLVTRRRRA